MELLKPTETRGAGIHLEGKEVGWARKAASMFGDMIYYMDELDSDAVQVGSYGPYLTKEQLDEIKSIMELLNGAGKEVLRINFIREGDPIKSLSPKQENLYIAGDYNSKGERVGAKTTIKSNKLYVKEKIKKEKALKRKLAGEERAKAKAEQKKEAVKAKKQAKEE